MHTLFLNPPSYGGFDGAAGAWYQARREIRSFRYPPWLVYPAGLIPKSRLINAPPAVMDFDNVILQAQGYDITIINTSNPTIVNDARLAELPKDHYHNVNTGFAGPHTMVLPEETLLRSQAIDFVTTGESGYAAADIARGIPLDKVDGNAFRLNGYIQRANDRSIITDLNALRFVTKIYACDLNVVFSAVIFFLYLAALSWSDLSFIMPLTTMSFFFASLTATFIPREDFTGLRWVGTIIIIIGISILSLDYRQNLLIKLW